MECELTTIIKQEKLSENNYIKLSYEIQVKEETESFDDWCIRNGLPELQSYEDISYEDLKVEDNTEICVLCHELFTDRLSLYKHNLVHLKVPLHEHKIYACDDCYYYSTKKINLEGHILEEHKRKKSKRKSLHHCKVCNKTFKYSHWWEHTNNVHGREKLKCEKCNMVFKCKRYLKKHIHLIHEGVKKSWHHKNVICPRCPSKFYDKHALRTHFKTCHSEQKYECEICKSVLKCRTYLLAHMRRVHYDDGKEHSCKVCCKTFRSPRYLKIHMKNSHSPYVMKEKTKVMSVS